MRTIGDLSADIAVVGGMVPTLLVDTKTLPAGVDPHVGSLDLDLGLALALRDGGLYKDLSERLRGAGFVQATNDKGHPTRQTWTHKEHQSARVDFLIPFGDGTPAPGRPQDLEPDFAATVAKGLHLAFRDPVLVPLVGPMIDGGKAHCEVRVCNPGAFLVLKAYVTRFRHENKDAYDLYFLTRYFGASVEDVKRPLRALMDDDATREAISFLRRDFEDVDSVGPRRVAHFFFGHEDEELQRDVVGTITALLSDIG